MATIGIHFLDAPPKRPAPMSVFLRTLEEARVTLVIDIRANLHSGVFNPRTLREALSECGIRYMARHRRFPFQRVLAPQREIAGREWAACRVAFQNEYRMQIRSSADALLKCRQIIETEYDGGGLAAFVGKGPFTPETDRCHRFVLANMLVEDGCFRPEEVLHLDLDATLEMMRAGV